MSNGEKQSEFAKWKYHNVNWDAGEMAADDTAAHLLKVAEEWCKANPESSFHPNHPCWDLYDYLKQYINGKAEVQG